MPFDRTKYPDDWEAIRAEVLARAGDRCEQCNVKNHTHVFRGTYDGEPCYQTADGCVYCANTGALFINSEYADVGRVGKRDKATPVVLTISHTDHDTTNNGEPGNRPNLKALCQRCHLLHDKDHHKANARATRSRKQGLQSLFE